MEKREKLDDQIAWKYTFQLVDKRRRKKLDATTNI